MKSRPQRRGSSIPAAATVIALVVVIGSPGLGEERTGPEGTAETYAVFRATGTPAPAPLLPGGNLLKGPVPGAKAEIVRHDDRIEFALTTTELQKHAHTVWVAAFNFPQFCRDPDTVGGRDFRCGPGDVPNVAAGFSMMYGAGRDVDVDEDAFVTFTGERHRLNLDGVIIGPGLIDPRGAEIHLVLRDHGPCPAEGCGDRTTTVDGGCSNPHFGGLLRVLYGEPGDYECANPQATGH